MSAPTWFDRGTYFGNKLVQLQEAEPDAGWDANKLEEAFGSAGYTNTADGLYEHFLAYGNKENISPSPWFVVDEYKDAKLAQLLADDPDGEWTMEKMEQAFEEAGLSYWDHYTEYGMYEGVSPSADFDNNAYMAAKLEQLQADDPDGEWTMEKMDAAFKEAGLNPIEHYVLYGKDEGVDYTPVTPLPTPDYELTTAIDDITGTANDDVIAGVASSLTSERTLNVEDKIQGGAGNDTLIVEMQGSFNGFTTGYAKGVENVLLGNESTITRSFNATGLEGVEAYTLKGAVSLTNVADAATAVNLEGQQKAVTIGFASKAVTAEDTFNLSVQGVGAAATDSAPVNHVKVNVTNGGFGSLAVTATGDNYADLSGVAAVKSMSVSGAGNLNVKAVANSVTSVDASAMTGNLTANLSGATLATLKGGAGDDVFTVNKLSATAVLEGGAGNDSLVLNSFSGTVQPTMSGFENVTADSGTITLSGKNASDFNSLTVKNSASVTLANVDAAAFTVTSSGANTGNNVIFSDATAFTYNTEASANTVKTANASDTVNTGIVAAKATSATVNVGAYTARSGQLDFNAATDVTVNVASGLGTDGETELTSFAGTLNAVKAESLTVNAEGGLGASTFNVGAASLVNITADQGSSGAVGVVAANATDVSITAGAAMNITGSQFGSAQNVTLTQNDYALNGSGVNLSAVHQLTVSGAGTDSKITVGNLGSATRDYGLTVDASGLKAGFTVDDVKDLANVNLNLADVTGAFKAATVASKNVTIHAAKLGTTEVTTSISADNVVIDALGILGGKATVDALKVGTIDATTAGEGSLDLRFDGSSDVTIGKIGDTNAFDSVTLDASDYLGAKVGLAATPASAEASIGTIKANTVTITGSEVGVNDFTVGSAVTANTLTFTGGLDADKVTLTAKADDSLTASLNTGAKDDTATITGIATTKTITVTGDMGGDSGDTVTVIAGASTSALTIDISGLNGYNTSILNGAAATGALTVKGGAGADTITAGGTGSTITGGAGADVMTGITGKADTFVQGVTDSGITAATADKIVGFVSTEDKIKTGTANTTGTNFGASVAADAKTFDAALTAANTAMNGTIIYYQVKVSADSYLFWDTNGDGAADQAIQLVGVTAALADGDIVA